MNKNFSRFHLFSSSGVFLLSAGMIACSHSPAPNPTAPLLLHSGDVVQAQETPVADAIQAIGTVQAVEQAQLAPQTSGTILSISVHQGSRVHAGQVLARINPALPQAGLQAAQASLLAAQNASEAAQSEYSLATSTLQRYQLLREKQSVSAQEFDEVQQRAQAAQANLHAAHAAEAQARAAVAQASTQASYSQIRAPFDGIITARMADPGALATPGVPLLAEESTSQYRLEVNVDEHDLTFIHLGSPVTVSLDLPQLQKISGTISEISPAADVSSRSFIVKILLPQNPLLRSGLYGSANFSRGQRMALLLPQKFVIQTENLSEIYGISSMHSVQLRYITLGQQHGDRVEVLSGLTPGEFVLPASLGSQWDGKQVEVLP